MKKSTVNVYIAVSVDGYIAKEDGDIGWLDEASQNIPKEEDCGYYDFFKDIDCLIMGRNTYEKVLTFGKWPYEKPVIVLSKKGVTIPKELMDKVSQTNMTPKELVNKLVKNENKKLYIDGGKTIQSFISENLVDRLIITTIPILLGKGIPLFGSNNQEIWLKHIESIAYPFGFVKSIYLTKRE
jgi:dihydrofolate reductase